MIINKLKKIIISNFLLSKIYFDILRILNRSYKKEVEFRKALGLFEYKKLSYPLKIYPTSYIKDNILYGNFKIFSSLKEFDKDECLVEHGLIFGSLVQAHNNLSFCKKIITFSEYRANFLRKKTSKEVIVTGPYLKYIEPLYTDDQLDEIKRNLGKVLLVFPSHSNDVTTMNFDSKEFIIEINKISKKFDSVVICLYWKDIQLGRDKEYLKNGFIITTAGHSYDEYFLSRLKSIIALSDFTMSNKVGTHLGYCILEGRGHYIFKQKIESQHKPNTNEDSQRDSNDKYTMYRDLAIVESHFTNLSYVPTKNQIDIVTKFWGDF